MDWQGFVIIALVLWAIYHTFAEMQQDKQIEKLKKAREQ